MNEIRSFNEKEIIKGAVLRNSSGKSTYYSNNILYKSVGATFKFRKKYTKLTWALYVTFRISLYLRSKSIQNLDDKLIELTLISYF